LYFHVFIDKTVNRAYLINKATRQTIEAFLEKSVWKIGVSTQ
jgi:hypothetical protein